MEKNPQNMDLSFCDSDEIFVIVKLKHIFYRISDKIVKLSSLRLKFCGSLTVSHV